MSHPMFRVWDGARKEWLHPSEWAFSLFGEVTLMSRVDVRMDGTCVPLEELNELVTMQRLSCKDAEGNYIFEGDIMRVRHRYDDEPIDPFTIEVCWSEDDNAFYGYRQDADGNEYTHVLWKPHLDRMTVIGNVFDNPNLVAWKRKTT